MVEETSEKQRSPSKMGDKSPTKEQKPPQRSGKGFTYEVVLLDGEHVNIELDRNADGKDLFEKVCQHLDLIEKDYFGLQYVDERIPQHLKCWLSPDKKISKQKKRGPWLFDFALKFYPPDPTQLRESLTRWLVVLQTRRDVLSGKLPATFLTQAMLGSYCVQADVGDYDSTEHHGIDYVKEIPFAPNQTTDLLEKIVELHRQHKGQTPDEAEVHFLENAKKLSMYGVDLHAAQDVNNVDIMLGVCASGLHVYRDKLRISRFVWPKILKISYKRKHFYIKVRPSDNSRLENSVSFKLASHRLAKRLWKICVEHHAFFRLREADQPQNAALFPRLGSKFRYSGRTLYQARHSSQILDRPDPYFERSQPARNTYAAPGNRSRSVDELANRPDHWKDDLDAVQRRRPSDSKDKEKEGRDRKDHMGQPTVISMLGLPEGMKPVENEEGEELEPGLDRSRDGKDRQDRKPGDDDATLEREGMQGTMGLTPSEMQKKAKEDEKERKKREKEEEKKRKKEEEDKKKAEKAAKKGKGKGATDPTAEDRTDRMGGGDATEKAPGRTSGSYTDQEGEPIRFGVVAPVGAIPGEKGKGKDKDKDKDRWSPRHDTGDRDRWAPGRDDPYATRWEPGTVPDVEMRDKSAPGRDGQWDPEKDEDKDRFSTFKDPGGKERWSFNKERPKSGQDKRTPGDDRDGRSPGREGEGRDRFVPGGDGREPYSPGRDGRSPGQDGDRFAPGIYGREPYSGKDGREPYSPGKDGREPYYPGGERDGRSPGRDGDDRDRFAPGVYGREPYSPGKEGDRDRWGPGREGERWPYYPGERDSRGPGQDGDRDRRGPGREGERGPYYPGGERDGRGPGQDGDRDRRGPGREGETGPYYPGGERDGRGPGQDGDRDRWGPGAGGGRDGRPRSGEEGRYYAPGEEPITADRDRWAPGVVVPLGAGRDGEDPNKKDRKDSDKDDDKDPKKKKDRKDSDKDDKDGKKGKKGKKDKDDDKKRKGSDKDDDKDKKDKKKDKDADKPEKEKKGGLFSKLKKPKDSKSKLPEEEEDHSRPEDHSYPDDRFRPGYGPGDDKYGPGEKYGPGAEDRSRPGYGPGDKYGPGAEDRSRPGYGPGDKYGPGSKYGPRAEDRSRPGYGPGDKGAGYPGYGPGGYGPGYAPRVGAAPGLGVGAGDMSGVVGDETWIDNKMRFEPIVPPKRETKQSLKSRKTGDIDHTMPFFSPAATSTVGRPGKVPPPVSPKPNASFDDSFSRRDYKTEKDGIQETRVEHRVVLSSNDDDFDYDAALADAIRAVTEFNPDMSVERIECVQQIEEVKDK